MQILAIVQLIYIVAQINSLGLPEGRLLFNSQGVDGGQELQPLLQTLGEESAQQLQQAFRCDLGDLGAAESRPRSCTRPG